jgi:hypothetical protein
MVSLTDMDKFCDILVETNNTTKAHAINRLCLQGKLNYILSSAERRSSPRDENHSQTIVGTQQPIDNEIENSGNSR